MSAAPIYYDIYQSLRAEGPLAHLVLIHGWGMNGSVWDRLIPELLPHYDLTIVDLPGFGRSPLTQNSYSLDFLVQSVLAVVPKKAIWLGWSFGGMVATQAAITAPNRIQALVNIASTPCWMQKKDWSVAIAEKLFREFNQRLTINARDALTRFLALQCKDSDSIKESIRYIRERAFLHGSPAPDALMSGLDLLMYTDLRTQLSQLTLPISYWLGERDSLIPVGLAEQLKILSPAIYTHMIPGTSHVPFVAHTELWVPDLQAWIHSLNLSLE